MRQGVTSCETTLNLVAGFEDVQEAAQSENLTKAELEAFFEYGYPDFNTVDDNHGLIILSNTLAEEHLELNSYKNTYHTGIRKYFE